jgi:acyl carrier protein
MLPVIHGLEGRATAGLPHTIFHHPRANDGRDVDLPAWDIGDFNREHLKHREYLIALEACSASRLLTLPVGRQTHRQAGPFSRHRPARTDTEKRIVSMWEELLGVHPIGVENDFFESGGHSMMAVQLVSRIQRAFRIELPLAVIFECPTVAGIAKRVDKLALPTDADAQAGDDFETIEL